MRLQEFNTKVLVHLRTNMFLVFFTLRINSVVSYDLRYEACRMPRNCGSGPNISYPFYFSGVDRDFCGHKGFETDCEDGKPVFRTSKGCYIVKDISYKHQWFRLLDADVANSSTCSSPNHYFAFDRSPIEFNSNHANLQFFYGCNKSFAPSFEKSRVSCVLQCY